VGCGELSLHSGAIGVTGTSDPSVARLLLRKLIGTNAQSDVLVAILFGDGTELAEASKATEILNAERGRAEDTSDTLERRWK
jgi:hypothetical protein